MTSKVSQKAMIPLRDKFNLSPIEKHIEYKRFPYKLIFHTFLVFLTTTQVLVMVDSEYTAHAREQFRMFKHLLLVPLPNLHYSNILGLHRRIKLCQISNSFRLSRPPSNVS